MATKVGTALVAPNGWHSLQCNIEYHLLRSDPDRGRIHLVQFVNAPKQAVRFEVPLAPFERALMQNVVVEAAQQYSLPPWLRGLEGLNHALIDQLRPGAEISHFDRVTERLLHMAPLIQNLDEILAHENPDVLINRYARACDPPQNETRFRSWVLTYLCFGRNLWSLMPTYHNCGGWDRYALHPERTFGRSAAHRGPGFGFPSKAVEDDIIAAYDKYSAIGKPLADVYRDAMLKHFKCVVVTEAGVKSYIQPEGKPIPTYEQFRYRVLKRYTQEHFWKTRYGEARHRNKIAASKGPFAEHLSCLLEKVEADGYYCNDRPRGLIDPNLTLPSLCVVRIRCLTSGVLVGIGFSLGGETGVAYRMALFCMSIGKVKFCQLFGLEIDESEWPSEGMSPHLGIDRGPASSGRFLEGRSDLVVIVDLAPAWTPRSKASVEASHPKDTHLEGEPTYVRSTLDVIQMCRREIRRLLKDNNSCDVTEKLTIRDKLALSLPTPLMLYKELDARARTMAEPMAFADAVRNFLPQIDVKVRDDGVWFMGQRFSSDELVATGIFDVVVRGQEMPVRAYGLGITTRAIWVDIDGKLIEVEMKLPRADDIDQTYVSLLELEKVENHAAEGQSRLRDHRHAAGSEMRQKVQEDTGKSFDGGTRLKGRAKRKAPAARTEKEALKA